MKKFLIGFACTVSFLSANAACFSRNCVSTTSDDMSLSDFQSSAYYQRQQNEKFAAAAKEGFTIGLNAGYATVNAFTTTNNSGFAWNGNLGYQFSPYFAIESGYTSFSDVNETGTVSGAPYTATDKYYGIDFLFKPIWPVTQHFNLFAKIGAMYFTAIRDIKTYPVGVPRLKHVVTQYNPEVGIGASYDFNRHIALSAQGVGTFYGFSTYAGYLGLIFKLN